MRKNQSERGGASVRFRHPLQSIRQYAHAGWCFPEDAQSEDRRHLVRYNLSANVVANLIGGNFYTGFLILLNADDAFIGLMTMLVYATNLLQLISPFLFERLKRRKPALIALRCAYHLINIVFVGFIPLVTGVTQVRMTLLAVCVLAANIINAVMAPGMSVWHMGHVPTRVRVPFFSVVSILNGVGVAVCNLAASALVDVFKASGFELYGLLTVRVLALLVAAYDIFLLVRVRDVPVTCAKKIRFSDFLTKPWHEKAYLRTVLIAFSWNVAANIMGPYYTVHLLRSVGMSYSLITGISMLNIPILLLATPLWRRVFARSSWMKPLAFALLIFAPRYFIESFVCKDLIFLFAIGEIWCYICMAGINLGFSSFAYINIPQNNQTVFVGFYSTLCNMGALIGATLGRAFVTSFEGLKVVVFGVPLSEKQILMASVGFIMMVIAWMTLRVWKTNASAQLET